MYTSKVKPEFRDNMFSDREHIIVCDMPFDKVLMYDPELRFLYDMYKNKLETPREEIQFEGTMEVVAKKPQYKTEYNLNGTFLVESIDKKVNIVSLDGTKRKSIFPSRLKVTFYAYKALFITDVPDEEGI